MSDIELVIKIPEEMYAQIIDENGIDTILIPYKDIINNGTPLPKGHGDLIDTNELNNFCKEHDVGISAINKELIYDDGKTSRGDTIWKPLLEVLSTIIEADKAESDG